MKLKLFLCLVWILLFQLPVAFSSDEVTSSEIAVFGITQFTRPAFGVGSFGTLPLTQSSKESFGGSVQYRRWFGTNGVAATYSVVASDASFKAISPEASMQSLEFPLTRHEVSGSYIKRLLPYSRLDPYFQIGAGELFTHGQLGARVNGVWIDQGYLGIDCQFEVATGAGLNLWSTRHFGIQAGYVIHWFRSPNFSDPSYHGSRTLITEPQVGFRWFL